MTGETVAGERVRDIRKEAPLEVVVLLPSYQAMASSRPHLLRLLLCTNAMRTPCSSSVYTLFVCPAPSLCAPATLPLCSIPCGGPFRLTKPKSKERRVTGRAGAGGGHERGVQERRR